MTERIWHSGPPPHVGWWVASSMEDIDCWRWWDGTGWSRSVTHDTAMRWVAQNASEPTDRKFSAKYIKWTDYWPKNARVERIKL